MKNFIFSILAIFILFSGCKKDNNDSTNAYNVNGYVQKGPFAKGTVVTISELKSDLSQTGRNFTTTIIDDKGFFEVSNLELSSSFVRLSANGYFFNEVTGKLSNAPIALNAIVNLQSSQSINVNLITTIESERVINLVKNGDSFDNAKTKARNDIYSIFGFSLPNSGKSETFDITQNGENNSKLLAISAIILGTNTEAELTELITGISSDIKSDGTLDNTKLQSSLINEATYLNVNTIKNNLIQRYGTLGVNVVINDFANYIESFVKNSNFTVTKKIDYPNSFNSLANVLTDSTFEIKGSEKYCIAAKLPLGTSLKVVYQPSAGANPSGIGVFQLENKGWNINIGASSVTLIGNGSNQVISVPFMLGPPTSVDFFIYENNSATPTKTKVIKYQ